jgi:LysM repeat protein
MTKHSPLFRLFASIGLVLGTVAGPAVGVPSASAACTSFIVERGDSWSLLADYAGVGLSSMLRANNASAKTIILPGQKLCVPKGATFNRPGSVVAEEATPQKLVIPKKRLSAAESEAIIRDIFPNKLERRALKIAQRESRLNHVAHSWCCLGLFQIYFGANKAFLGTLGITNASQLLDARTNATAAYAMYQRSGWAPWE